MDIFTARGPPLTVQSDRGKEFTAKIFMETLKMAGIHSQQGTPYTPTSQSIVERTNTKIKQKRCFKAIVSKRKYHLGQRFRFYTINN